jgi:DNA-binding transcriptional LysR family regulator
MDRFASIAVFVAAVDEGSLVAAGRRFGLSASMAGKYVSALEAELNVRLLHRSTRSLSLTDAGRAYYVRCQRILEEFDDANREASDAHGTVRGTLRVAAPVTFGTLHMGEVVARYLDDHPHVNIEVSLDDRYVDLQSAGIDVAIRIGQLPDSDLVARRLAPCRMAMCASPAFLEREGTPQDPEDLRRAPRLAFNEAVSVPEWVLTDKQNREHVIDGPLRMQANNMQMLLSAALAGVGIAYGPTFVLGKDIKAGNLVKLLPDYRTAELTINAVYPTARYVPSKVRQFIDYLAKAFKDEPPWDRY